MKIVQFVILIKLLRNFFYLCRIGQEEEEQQGMVLDFWYGLWKVFNIQEIEGTEKKKKWLYDGAGKSLDFILDSFRHNPYSAVESLFIKRPVRLCWARVPGGWAC